MLGTLVYIYSSKTRVRKVSKLAVFFLFTEGSGSEIQLTKVGGGIKAGSNDLVSREEKMTDEVSSNVELDLDSADEVVFYSEYIQYCFLD